MSKKLAYADPPYEGQARKHYGSDAAEVNLPFLISYLEDSFDGWALSAKSNSLGKILQLCPGARVGAWSKPFAVSKPGVAPAYTWEPVIFRSARGASDLYRRDSLVCNPNGRFSFVGSKPRQFCEWLFADLLGAAPGDYLEDLFPGSGGVSLAWEVFCLPRAAQLELTA